jgi:hypothetical protein
MQTIQSRAQLLTLTYDLEEDFDSDVREDALKLLDILNDKSSIIENKYYTDKYKSVLEFDNFLDCLIVELKKYISTLDNFDIIKKENCILKMIIDMKSNINKNCNVNLMLDKLIIEVGRL